MANLNNTPLSGFVLIEGHRRFNLALHPQRTGKLARNASALGVSEWRISSIEISQAL